jgi:hypothetical protein
MPDAGTFSPTVAMARNRWRSAEDRLYPTLIADPSTYQRSIKSIQAVVAAIRERATGVDDIIALEAAPDDLLAAALPAGSPVPPDLLIGVACGMADREISADAERRRREAAIEQARAAGRTWAVLAGPDTLDELADGRRPELHLASNTIMETAVDPWSGEDPFSVQVTDGSGRAVASLTFADRDAWVAEIERLRAEVEGAGVEQAEVEAGDPESAP